MHNDVLRSDNWEAKALNHQHALKKAGLKVTHPRVIVLQILQSAPDNHFSAEDIYRRLLDDGKDVGLATVYRVLNQFEDADIVDRHHFEGGKSVFELANKIHHDHLMCLSCGRIVEFVDEVIEKQQESLAKRHQMRLTHHSLYLYGYCISGCEEAIP